MKKLLLVLLFVPIVTFGQTEKLKETLIKKSIKWTEVASTGRNYEEAKKFLIPKYGFLNLFIKWNSIKDI